MQHRLTERQAQALSRRLAHVVCSVTWLERVRPSKTEDGWDFHDSVYPPGGAKTAMRNCSECQRIAPVGDGVVCCIDCQVERAEVRHYQCLCATDEEVADELTSRWWTRFRRPWEDLGQLCCWNEEQDRPPAPHLLDMAKRLGLRDPMVRWYDPIPATSLTLPSSDVRRLLRTELNDINGQVTKGVRSVTRRLRKLLTGMSGSELIRSRGALILRYLRRSWVLIRHRSETPSRNVSIGSGRSAGCGLTLLPENEASLQREIEHFLRTGEVIPRARRFSLSHPGRRAPEDQAPMNDCFGPLPTRKNDRR
jgi:hypothetical protein